MTRARGAAPVTVPAMMRRTDRPGPRLIPNRYDGSSDPAIVALTQLLESERDLHSRIEPAPSSASIQAGSGCCGLRFGATEEICKLVRREVNERGQRDLRQVVTLVFGGGLRSPVNPVMRTSTSAIYSSHPEPRPCGRA